ncbi:MAG: N-acyl homoserine lactonase family protein [Chloroflexota bacterium]
MKLTILRCGLLDADRAVIHPEDDSHRRVLLPIPALLIQGVRTILIDTGCPPVVAGNDDGLHDAYDVDLDWIHPRVREDERIDVQLAKAGLQIQDLDLVICTHFHFDHAGGNALFAGHVPIAAQEAEVLATQDQEYMPVWDAPGLQFEIVRGDWSPMPGVEMLHTPGHTPGHQSVLLRLDEQPWLFTVDAVYTEEHWRRGKLGAVTDVAAARASIERIRSISASEDARLIFGHDFSQWESLGKAPETYS